MTQSDESATWHRFSQLDYGWLGPDFSIFPEQGLPITALAMVTADEIIKGLATAASKRFSVFPTELGGVQLEWQELHTEVTIAANGEIEIFLGADRDEDCVFLQQQSIEETQRVVLGLCESA